MPQDMQKATTINRRQSATSLMPNRIRRWVTKDRRSRGSLNKIHVFRLNWIKDWKSRIDYFQIDSLAENKKYN